MKLKKIVSAYLGNLFEHYDTALFGFLSPYLAPLIFPTADPVWALIYTYMLFPLGRMARPFGALLFGYIGDRHGREQALFITLGGMGIVSGLIAFTPLSHVGGTFVPLVFCLQRILQNVFAAGETIGGGIYLLENSDRKKSDVYSGFYGMTSIGGHLLASFAVFVLLRYFSIEPGWRYLYAYGSVTALFGCFIRKGMKKSPPLIEKKNLLEVVKQHSSLVVNIAIVSGFSYATYYLAMVLMNGFIPLITTIDKAELMKMNTLLLVFDFSILPLFGWVASKFNRNTYLLVVNILSVALLFPLVSLLDGASFGAILITRIVLVIFGVAFCAPFHAWCQSLVPRENRYTIISLGYALGSLLLGSPTSFISLWCYKSTGIVSSIIWYWVLLGSLSALTFLKEPLKTHAK